MACSYSTGITINHESKLLDRYASQTVAAAVQILVHILQKCMQCSWQCLVHSWAASTNCFIIVLHVFAWRQSVSVELNRHLYLFYPCCCIALFINCISRIPVYCGFVIPLFCLIFHHIIHQNAFMIPLLFPLGHLFQMVMHYSHFLQSYWFLECFHMLQDELHTIQLYEWHVSAHRALWQLSPSLGDLNVRFQ